jgi:DNA-binding protein YbaB
MPTEPRNDDEALAAYIARIRNRLPSTAGNFAHLAGVATSLRDDGIDPDHFKHEFSGLIKSLHVMGVTMDNASKDLAKRRVTGTDSRSLVEVRCTAQLADLSVKLSPGAMKLSAAELEQATTDAFTAMLNACRDLTLTTVEGASSRAAARRQ